MIHSTDFSVIVTTNGLCDPNTNCAKPGSNTHAVCVYAPPTPRVMIADFSSGKPPLQVKYWENWGEEKILDGWIDKFINLARNFTALGDDQLFLLTQ